MLPEGRSSFELYVTVKLLIKPHGALKSTKIEERSKISQKQRGLGNFDVNWRGWGSIKSIAEYIKQDANSSE